MQRWISLWLGAGVLAVVAAVAGPALADAAALNCPAPVRAQIDGLYRWQLADQDRRPGLAIASQRQRFTPQLYALLKRAYALQPSDGRFVDFDPFSGTQVSTFGATLLECSRLPSGGLEARVAVRAGLRNRPGEPTQLLRFVLAPSAGSGWQIDDIAYPTQPAFRLKAFLLELLEVKR